MKSLTEHIKRASLAVVALSSLGGIQTVLAAGTAVGIPVDNQATVSYSVGTVSQTPVPSNVSRFLVDKKVDVLITPILAASTAANSTDVPVSFDVKNEGNATDSFTFTQALSSGITLNSVRIYQDNPTTGTVGSWDIGDTLITPATTAVSFTSDETKRFFIISNVPGAATNGQTAVYTLTATTTSAENKTAADDPLNVSGPDVVFAEGSGAPYDGAISANETYTISAAGLSVIKSAVVVSDGVGGVAPNAKAIPGATVEYTIRIANALGGAAAAAVSLADPIPTNTTYLATFMTYQVNALAASALNEAADTDEGAYISTGTPRIVIGNATGNAGSPVISVPAGESVTVKFRVTVN